MTKQKRTTSLQRRQDRRLAALTKSGAPGPKLLADLFNKPIEEMRANKERQMMSNESQLRKARTTTTKLEHRHFATIATIIANMPDAARRGEVAKHFAVQLGETNRKFDRERFIRACLEEK